MTTSNHIQGSHANHSWRLVAAIALIVTAGSMRVSHALPSQTVPFNYGIQVSFDVTEQDLDYIRDSGVKWVRTVMNVGNSLASYDAFVQRTWSRGMFPVFVLIGDVNNPPRTQAARNLYINYATAAASRYQDNIVVWEIWNEPNNATYWGGTPNAAEYATLAIQAGSAIKQVSTHTVIGPAAGQIDVPYIQQVLLAQPTLLHVLDGVSVHPYENSPTSIPETRLVQYANLANAISSYIPPGRDVRIVCSEWGYSQQFVSETAQAAYLLRSWMVNHQIGSPLSIYYNLRDNAPGMPGWWGVLRNDYTEKNSYKAIQVLTSTLSGHTYIDRLATASTSDFILRFFNPTNNDWKYVAWTIAEAHSIPLQTGAPTTIKNYLGASTVLNPGPNGFISLPLNALPKYVDVP
jgi:hypothetical protein